MHYGRWRFEWERAWMQIGEAVAARARSNQCASCGAFNVASADACNLCGAPLVCADMMDEIAEFEGALAEAVGHLQRFECAARKRRPTTTEPESEEDHRAQLIGYSLVLAEELREQLEEMSKPRGVVRDLRRALAAATDRHVP